MKTKDEIKKNLISLSSIDLLSMIIPIIIMPIITRTISADVYGEYLYFITLITFAFTFIDYGIQYTGVSEVSRYRDNKEKVIQGFQELQTLRWLFLVFYCFIIMIYLYFSKQLEMLIIFSKYGVIYLLGYVSISAWFFQALGKMELLIVNMLLTKVVNLVVILLFVNSNEDIALMYLSTSLPMFFIGFVQYKKLYQLFGVRIFHITTFNIIRDRVKTGFDVFVGILAPNFYSAIPSIYLGSVSNPAEYAKFMISTRLFALGVTVQNIFFKSVFPVLSKSKDNHVRKLCIVNLIFSILAVILTLSFGDYILTIFLGDKYFGVNYYLSFLIPGLIFIGLSESISQGYFLSKGYKRNFRNVSLRVSFVAAISGFILIYNYGLMGGVISLTLARLLFYIEYSREYFQVINKLKTS